MMSDWSKTRSLASEDVGPNHMMSCPGGFSSDRDPSLDILLDAGYSDLGYIPNLEGLDSGLYLNSMIDLDVLTPSQDFDMTAFDQLNLDATGVQQSDDQSMSK